MTYKIARIMIAVFFTVIIGYTPYPPPTFEPHGWAENIQKSKSEPEAEMVEQQYEQPEESIAEDTEETEEMEWQGDVLNPVVGIVDGPSGEETYYNLPMGGVLDIMQSLGYGRDYWIREDGVKMLGNYIMCAANLDIRPRGTILETSLGTAIVCDTGAFVETSPYRVDIAVDW